MNKHTNKTTIRVTHIMPYLEPNDPLILIFVIILGLILGSFATAVAYRLPKGEDFVSGHN